MITNNNDKKCANCKHFDRYYTKNDAGFRPLVQGICKHKIPNIKRIGQAKAYADEICEFWVQIDKTEKQQNILNALQKMSIKLEELTFILKHDL